MTPKPLPGLSQPQTPASMLLNSFMKLINLTCGWTQHAGCFVHSTHCPAFSPVHRPSDTHPGQNDTSGVIAPRPAAAACRTSVGVVLEGVRRHLPQVTHAPHHKQTPSGYGRNPVSLLRNLHSVLDGARHGEPVISPSLGCCLLSARCAMLRCRPCVSAHGNSTSADAGPT